jgi:hypothetical protein
MASREAQTANRNRLVRFRRLLVLKSAAGDLSAVAFREGRFAAASG